jgi:hypothetical protein
MIRVFFTSASIVGAVTGLAKNIVKASVFLMEK